MISYQNGRSHIANEEKDSKEAATSNNTTRTAFFERNAKLLIYIYIFSVEYALVLFVDISFIYFWLN